MTCQHSFNPIELNLNIQVKLKKIASHNLPKLIRMMPRLMFEFEFRISLKMLILCHQMPHPQANHNFICLKVKQKIENFNRATDANEINNLETIFDSLGDLEYQQHVGRVTQPKI